MTHLDETELHTPLTPAEGEAVLARAKRARQLRALLTWWEKARSGTTPPLGSTKGWYVGGSLRVDAECVWDVDAPFSLLPQEPRPPIDRPIISFDTSRGMFDYYVDTSVLVPWRSNRREELQVSLPQLVEILRATLHPPETEDSVTQAAPPAAPPVYECPDRTEVLAYCNGWRDLDLPLHLIDEPGVMDAEFFSEDGSLVAEYWWLPDRAETIRVGSFGTLREGSFAEVVAALREHDAGIQVAVESGPGDPTST